MFYFLHITLLSIGILFLIAQNFVWNLSFLVLGIGACVAAFFSVFFDPYLFSFL